MSNVESQLEAALKEAYDRGFTDGRESAGDMLMQALQKMAPAKSPPPPLDTDIGNLGFPQRAVSCFRRARVNNLGDLMEKYDQDLLAITHFGQKSLDDVDKVLGQWGMRIKSCT